METRSNIPSPTPGSAHPGRTAVRVVAGVLVLGALFTVGLLPKLRNDAQLVARAKSVDSELPEVEIAHPRLAPSDPITLPGNIEALTATSIQARTSGYIRKLYVDIGAHVKAGQVLADI